MHFCHILMDKAVIGLAQIQRNRGKRPHLSMGGRGRGRNKDLQLSLTVWRNPSISLAHSWFYSFWNVNFIQQESNLNPLFCKNMRFVLPVLFWGSLFSIIEWEGIWDFGGHLLGTRPIIYVISLTVFLCIWVHFFHILTFLPCTFYSLDMLIIIGHVAVLHAWICLWLFIFSPLHSSYRYLVFHLLCLIAI